MYSIYHTSDCSGYSSAYPRTHVGQKIIMVNHTILDEDCVFFVVSIYWKIFAPNTCRLYVRAGKVVRVFV